MTPFGAKGVTAFTMRYSKKHCHSVNSTRFLLIPYHPLHKNILRKYERRTDSLWWSFLTSVKISGTKKVVRTWLTRRMRTAFTSALKEKGYDNGGRLLEKKPGMQDLRGTASFVLAEPAIRTSVEDLKKQSLLVIDAIERIRRPIRKFDQVKQSHAASRRIILSETPKRRSGK
jgi:hypothetical protein